MFLFFPVFHLDHIINALSPLSSQLPLFQYNSDYSVNSTSKYHPYICFVPPSLLSVSLLGNVNSYEKSMDRKRYREGEEDERVLYTLESVDVVLRDIIRIRTRREGLHDSTSPLSSLPYSPIHALLIQATAASRSADSVVLAQGLISSMVSGCK